MDVLETIREKIAYLRGIIDGDPSLAEGRNAFLFGKVLEILESLAYEVEDLTRAQEELDEYLEEVDFDLAMLEDEMFMDEEDDCEHDDWDDESLVDVECPVCDYIVTFDEEFLFDEGVEIRCPRCDAIVFESADGEELDDLFTEDAVEDED